MFDKYYRKYRYSLILLRELVITDFKLRYQNSVLGYLWALLRPLFMFMIMYVFFVVVLHVGKGVRNWGVDLLLGLVMWSFFQEVVTQGLKSIVSNGGMIRKINFPKYIIVVSKSVSAIINLSINLVVVAIFGIVSHVEPTWGILLVPVFILEVYVLALGMAFILSTINVRYRDIGYIWDIITQALVYGSAIMFPINIIEEHIGKLVSELLLINPVAQAIQDARYFAVGKDITTAHTLTSNILVIAAPFIVTIVIFTIGAVYFRRRSPYFAEEV